MSRESLKEFDLNNFEVCYKENFFENALNHLGIVPERRVEVKKLLEVYVDRLLQVGILPTVAVIEVVWDEYIKRDLGIK